MELRSFGGSWAAAVVGWTTAAVPRAVATAKADANRARRRARRFMWLDSSQGIGLMFMGHCVWAISGPDEGCNRAFAALYALWRAGVSRPSRSAAGRCRGRRR